jgi:hypothetical protein
MPVGYSERAGRLQRKVMLATNKPNNTCTFDDMVGDAQQHYEDVV